MEPEIITQDREQLAYLLTEAAEIEHGLLCCYLFAAFSLKQGESSGLTAEEAAATARWRGAIVQVAVDEMLHLTLVSNLLTAIGAPPHLQRPNFPVAPGYHPAGVVVALAPFELATLDHFVYLERPEGIEAADGAGFEHPPRYERATRADVLVPSSQDYATVGHLYRGIRAGFSTLAQTMGERALLVGDPQAQVGPEIMPMQGLSPVTDLASALRAVDTIVEQGEGSPTNPERSHYRRFVAVRDEYRAMAAERPSFQPAYPVAHNPVMRKPPDPRGKVHVSEPTAARAMDLGNALYGLTLRMLAHAFGQAEDAPRARRVLVEGALEAMGLLSPIAEQLCRRPANPANPGVHAGLSFVATRSSVGFSQPRAAWTILAERTREIAAGFAAAAKEIDPSLLSTAERLMALSKRIEQAPGDGERVPSPVVRPPAAADVPPTPPATTAPAAAVEEARGSRLVVRFEGKRCIHARHCVLGAPDVFRANVAGPWLNADGASVDAVVAIAHACPSGAIGYERLDGGPPERPPPVNVLRVRENGPLAVHAEMHFADGMRSFRATLCRCGASKNKPFCDSSHLGANFVATGEPAPQPSTPLAKRNGVLAIAPMTNGPLAVTGSLEICSGTGRTISRVESARLCRCGSSANKPFCDGTHARIGFRAA